MLAAAARDPDMSLVKSPNCVTCGVVVALKVGRCKLTL